MLCSHETQFSDEGIGDSHRHRADQPKLAESGLGEPRPTNRKAFATVSRATGYCQTACSPACPNHGAGLTNHLQQAPHRRSTPCFVRLSTRRRELAWREVSFQQAVFVPESPAAADRRPGDTMGRKIADQFSGLASACLLDASNWHPLR
jgi:hypothetical protein